ncbi:hypothetical protein DPMN_164129 [Dreissena polymorpha]|uniref:Uncharacterized protein n=1 Tax=Dreissena polymorpha TaxID=45954 RepID=A0A9D4EUL6_DREPO|nr:hypothetical protein DPMN_164129 [Dreissena polymorpha]
MGTIVSKGNTDKKTIKEIVNTLHEEVKRVESEFAKRIELLHAKLSTMYANRDEVEIRIRNESAAAINEVMNELSAKVKKTEKELFRRIENNDDIVTSNENRDDLVRRITDELASAIKTMSSEFDAKIKCLENKIASKSIDGKDYNEMCNDFIGQLIHFYMKTQSCVSVSPMWTGNDKNIRDIFVQSKLIQVKLEQDGSWKKTDAPLDKYKKLLYTGDQLNSLVFMQGESGSGKSTFLSKLVLDWCEAMSPQTEGTTLHSQT